MNDFQILITPILGLILIIEITGQRLLIKFFFNFGIPFSKSVIKEDISNHNVQINKIYKKDVGKFKFISKTECIFTSRWYFFSFFRSNSLIPTKNICLISRGKYEIISRLPFSILLLIIYLLINILYKLLLGYVIFTLLIVIIMIMIMYFIEHKRVTFMKEELIEIIRSS